VSNDKTDKLPPHAHEAEQGVLGCALLSPATVLEELVTRKFDEKEFYDLRHQVIYAALLRLHTAGQPVEMLSLMQALKEAAMLEEIGGLVYLNELQDVAVSAASWSHYAEQVKDKAKLRRLIALATSAGARAMDATVDVDKLLSEVSNDFIALSEDVTAGGEAHIGDILRDQVLPELEEHYTRGKTNLPPNHLSTGFDYWDKVGGGIAPQDYFVLAGRPGSGKTTMAQNIIHKLVLAGVPVGVFSLEMSQKSLGKRLMFEGARVSAGKFRQGFATQGDFAKLIAATGPLSKAPLWIDAEPSQTIGQITAKARRLVRQHGVKVFVLDYMQLVLPDKRAGRIDRVQELTDISARFVALKKALNVPWIILAQMNRNIEQAEANRVPVLSDLKDCGAIEQDADQVLFLYFPERSKKEGDKRDIEEGQIDEVFSGEHTERPQRVNLFQAKHREGATGAVEMLFHKNQLRFEDWRQFKLAQGFADYGAGERKNANPLEAEKLISEEDVPK
jgi:replicative DNA helicase